MPASPPWLSLPKYLYGMQNMSFGADGGLTEACRVKHPTEPHLCFMSPHMVDTINTPLFIHNSKYDAWQLGNIFQSEFVDKAEQNGVLQYGADFMQALEPLTSSPTSPHGGLITSCICHGVCTCHICPCHSRLSLSSTLFYHPRTPPHHTLTRARLALSLGCP